MPQPPQPSQPSEPSQPPQPSLPSEPSLPSDRAGRELTGEFWAGVDRSELLRPVCGRCERSFFTPQVVCPHCGCEQWGYEPSEGRGTVYSFSVVHRPPEPGFEAPYVLAIVDVTEGWSLLTWIVDCPASEVRIGMKVKVRFVPGPDGALLPAFAPCGAEVTP